MEGEAVHLPAPRKKVKIFELYLHAHSLSSFIGTGKISFTLGGLRCLLKSAVIGYIPVSWLHGSKQQQQQQKQKQQRALEVEYERIDLSL